MVEFRAFGGPRITVGDEDLNLGGPRQRRLVAMLVIHRNTVVSVDRLADAVFAGRPTPRAATTLRSYVARLRKVISVDPGSPVSVITQAPGYELRLPDDAFDGARLEAAVSAARTLLAQDDPGRAAVLLDDVADLFRGRPYDEFEDEDWARPEAQRLSEMQAVAQETRLEAHLACGRAAEIIPDLEAMVSMYPLREVFRSQLMLALYRSGRQADALRAYQDHRTTMLDELGLDPAPALVALEERILAHDQQLLATGPAEVALRGYRLGERLGTGNDGTVHAAHLPGVDRDLVIRVVRADVADRSTFVRSFDATAHRVAALRHPAIVPIHDHWREPGAAYLVMRRMRGGTLADRLDRDEVDSTVLEAVVRRVGGALVAAHDAGISHGRVSAKSVLYDETDEPFLSDFMLEANDSELARDRDVLDFATLIEACACRRSCPGPVNELLADVDRGERPPLSTFVAQLVDALADGATSSGDVPTNPYKGLHSFDEADAPDFHGRHALVDEMVERLGSDGRRGRLVLLVGGSGTGKSSVVRAGLLPRIRRGDPPGAEHWFVTTMLPGSDPFAALGEGLRQVAVTDTADLATELGASVDGIDRVIRRLLPERGQLLLVIDQFEELFTSTPEPRQRVFLDGVIAAVEHPDSRLRVVMTLRADFYDRPLSFHRFGAAVRDATVTITAMSPAELETAIVAPAARTGRSVEGPLVAELVNAVSDEPAGLPALQFTLFELAERSDDTLRLSDYRAIGGLEGAIAARAEELYQSLGADDQTAIRLVFEQLVQLGDDGSPTRRRTARTDLIESAGGPDVDPLIDRWAEARLLTLDRNETTRVPTVDLAHEALLREWPRLQRWIEDDREAITVLGQMQDAASGWLDLDRDPGALYRGARLGVAVDVAASGVRHLSRDQQEFLEASIATQDEEARLVADRMRLQARANRRLRGQLLVIGIALVIALVGGFVAVDQRRSADTARRVATSRELAAASEASIDEDPERAILLALEAIEATRRHGDAVRPEAVAALHQAVSRSRVVLSVPGVGGALDWSPDGSVFVTEGPEESGIVDLRDAATGESVLEFVGHEVDINEVAFGPDGSTFATAGDDGAVRVWETETGDLVFEYEGPEGGPVWGPSISPDGRLVAAGWEKSETVRIIDMQSGEIVRETPDAPVVDTDFSPDGRLIVLSGVGGLATIVADVASGAWVHFLGDGSIGPTYDAAFSPDGRWIATADGDNLARIWDAETGAQRFTIAGHSTAVNAVDWSADSTKLATVAYDGTARVTEITEGGTQQKLVLSARDTRNGLISVAFSPDGDRIMAGDLGIEAVKVWDITPTGGDEWMNAETLPFAPGSGAFTPDGAAVLVSRPDGSVTTLDATTGRERLAFDIGPLGGDPVKRLAIDPTGARVAGATTLPVHLWDAHSGRHLGTTEPPPDDEVVYIVSLAWSADGQHLAISAARGGDRGWISIVDRAGTEVAKLDAKPEMFIGSVAFDPTGRYLVAGRIPPNNEPSREGFDVWDWRAGTIVRDAGVAAQLFAADPSSTRMVSARRLESFADIWDTATGDQVLSVPSTASIYSVAFRPDGEQVAIGAADGTVQLWDADDGDQELVLAGHTSAIGSLSFSPDGRRLASVDENGMLRVWALDLDELITLARQRLTRSLQDDECHQYLHLDECPD